jgi:hypothetical protein
MKLKADISKRDMKYEISLEIKKISTNKKVNQIFIQYVINPNDKNFENFIMLLFILFLCLVF